MEKSLFSHEEMDTQHRQIFRVVNKLHETVELDLKKTRIDEILADLIEFTTPGTLKWKKPCWRTLGYPGSGRQTEQHQIFISRVLDVQKAVVEGNLKLDAVFLDFFKDWMVYHISTDDRQHAGFIGESD